MKKLLSTLALSLVLGINTQAMAETSKPDTNAAKKPSIVKSMNIGIIDVNAVLATSKEAVAIGEKLKKEFKPKEDEIIALETTFKENAEKLQRNKSIMSETERGKLEKTLGQNQRDLQRLKSDYSEDAQQRQREELNKFVNKVNDELDILAEKEKYDLILASTAVPYASEDIDVTKKIIQELDKKFK